MLSHKVWGFGIGHNQEQHRSIVIRTTFIGWISELANDVTGHVLFDLPMPGYGLGDTRDRVAVPVVLGSVPDQLAAELLDGPDQIQPLHETTNSPTLRVPGICPPVRSS